MLSVASLNALSLSQTTSGYSESLDLEVVDEIINKAPREATTFPLVYKAYLDVLQEHGISSHEDTVYYQFLLKLGVIRERTWGQRWDVWRATHGSPASLPFKRKRNDGAVPQSDTLSNRSVSGPSRSPIRQQSAAALVAQTRAKLPFLASASSDLDEGFATTVASPSLQSRSGVSMKSSHSRDADGETETRRSGQGGHRNGPTTRASPRKRMEQSAQPVGGMMASFTGAAGHGDPSGRYPRSQGSSSPRRHDVPLETLSTRSDGEYLPAAAAKNSRYGPQNSTPVSRSTRARLHDAGLGATPPPYTESDVSLSFTQDEAAARDIDLTADDLVMIEGLATPRARSEHLPSIGSRRLVDIVSVTSATHTDVAMDTEAEEQMLYAEQTVIEMERRAEEFYRTGLVGRCWDTLVQSYEWIRTTTDQIDSVRQAILLRQALARWQNHQSRVLEQPNTADAHCRAQLQRKALQKWSERLKGLTLQRRFVQWTEGRNAVRTQATWTRWRGMLDRKVQLRYRAELARREKGFVKEREELLVQDTLARWRGELRTKVDTRLADSFFAARVLARWRYRAKQERLLSGQITVWEATKRRHVLSATLDHWHRANALVGIERLVVDNRDRRVGRDVLSAWAHAAEKEKQARKADERRLLRAVFQTWQKHHLRLKNMERQASMASAASDQSLLRQVFAVWTTQERGQLLVRVRDQRHVRSALEQWKSASSALGQKEQQAKAFRAASDLRLKGAALSHIQSSFAARRQRQRHAEAADDSRLLTAAFRSWKCKTDRIKGDEKHADAARAFFVQHTALTVWKVELARRKQERFVRAKEEDRRRLVLHAWRHETLRALEGRALADQFRQQANKALLSKLLLHWTDRFITLKSRELEIASDRRADLLRTTFIQWAKRGREIQDGKRLANSFADLRAEAQAKEALRAWRDTALGKRQRRETLAIVLENKRKAATRDAWEHWRGKVLEKRLAPLEEEVALRREDTLLFSVWDRWKGNAKELPAISFNKRRILRRAWERMEQAHEIAKAIRDFSGPRNSHLLATVFEEWKLRARAKTVARVGRVRGRVRPSHNLDMTTLAGAHMASPALTAHRPQHRAATPSEKVTSYQSVTEGNSASPAYSRLRSELSASRSGSALGPTSDTTKHVDEEASSQLVRALRNLGTK